MKNFKKIFFVAYCILFGTVTQASYKLTDEQETEIKKIFKKEGITISIVYGDVDFCTEVTSLSLQQATLFLCPIMRKALSPEGCALRTKSGKTYTLIKKHVFAILAHEVDHIKHTDQKRKQLQGITTFAFSAAAGYVAAMVGLSFATASGIGVTVLCIGFLSAAKVARDSERRCDLSLKDYQKRVLIEVFEVFKDLEIDDSFFHPTFEQRIDDLKHALKK